MGGKNKKRNQSKRKHKKNSRTEGVGNKEVPRQSRDFEDNQIVAYDPEFAKRQKLLHHYTCVVCRKQDYFMISCSRCQLARCCNGECLRKHCSQDNQRIICVRNVTFSKARERIPSHLKDTIFKLGFTEISPHIYSIPRFEVYLQMGGTRSVILVQVMSVQIVNNFFNHFLQVVVQDINGLGATLYLYPHSPALFLLDIFWCEQVMQSIPIYTFILLWNCCWNNHANMESAAVEIRDLNLITRLEYTPEIMKLITQKDYDAMLRSLQDYIT